MSEEKPYKSVWGWDSVWEHLSWFGHKKIPIWIFLPIPLLVQLWKDIKMWGIKMAQLCKASWTGWTHSSVFKSPLPLLFISHTMPDEKRRDCLQLIWVEIICLDTKCNFTIVMLFRHLLWVFSSLLPIPFWKSFLEIENKDPISFEHDFSVC